MQKTKLKSNKRDQEGRAEKLRWQNNLVRYRVSWNGATMCHHKLPTTIVTSLPLSNSSSLRWLKCMQLAHTHPTMSHHVLHSPSNISYIYIHEMAIVIQDWCLHVTLYNRAHLSEHISSCTSRRSNRSDTYYHFLSDEIHLRLSLSLWLSIYLYIAPFLSLSRISRGSGSCGSITTGDSKLFCPNLPGWCPMSWGWAGSLSVPPSSLWRTQL